MSGVLWPNTERRNLGFPSSEENHLEDIWYILEQAAGGTPSRIIRRYRQHYYRSVITADSPEALLKLPGGNGKISSV